MDSKKKIKEIIKDWIQTIPLDQNPSEKDYAEVAQDIWALWQVRGEK
ncbi:hypothetical protein LCGC14_1487520 [marine sediment metagenome]|uniref:Uncharacterized protein n=1 Tax=marine sediment metagenome TaxID=412755 RepID=A0A0F9JTL6_9ZZZZ